MGCSVGDLRRTKTAIPRPDEPIQTLALCDYVEAYRRKTCPVRWNRFLLWFSDHVGPPPGMRDGTRDRARKTMIGLEDLIPVKSREPRLLAVAVTTSCKNAHGGARL
jgi:hypothetical protein